MQKKLIWQAFSNADRTTAIDELKSAINQGDGYIVNFNIYSDLAIAMSIGIEERNINKLHELLSTKLKISDYDASEQSEKSIREWIIFLNVSFGKGTGDMKTEVPSVPG